MRVQHGQLTCKFQKFRLQFAETDNNSFSIMYDDTSTSLDLIAANEEDFNLWFDGLRALLKKYHREQYKISPSVRYLQSCWYVNLILCCFFTFLSRRKGNIDKDDKISKREVVNLLYYLNLNRTEQQILSASNEVAKSSFTMSEFYRLIEILRRRL